MNFSKYIVMGLTSIMALTSCNDYLDINQNPNSPTEDDAAYYQRLPWMEFYTNSAYQFCAMRTNMGCGDWTMNLRTSTYGAYSQWQMTNSPVTTGYQWWFVGAGSNIEKALEKAEENEAWHYLGATYLIKAYGFMLMTDIYGEMPYTEALTSTIFSPKYDNGKTIFKGCLDDIDNAIKYLSMDQSPLVQPLSVGDFWANGDVNKWIKMAYLLKARWLNHLIKKGPGKAADLKYDADEILACLDKAMKSNADNVWINHTDDNSKTHDVLGWDEPVDYSPLYSVIGMNSNYYVTKTLVDNFTNFGGYGVEDPRADHVIPWAVSQPSANTPAGIVFKNGWRRSAGLDLTSTIRTTGAPYTTTWDATGTKGTGSGAKYRPDGVPGFVCESTNPDRFGDTIYIQETSSSKGYAANRNLLYYRDRANFDDRSAMSGVFHTRVSSPTYIATYHEACFIKAEVLFNKGDRSGAFAAYKEGIKANIEAMNDKLKVWVGEDSSLGDCPSFTPMEQAEIDNYLNNGIGQAGNLTLAMIMTQKHMAMMFSVEQFNDMRRYDYNPQIFMNWNVPGEYNLEPVSMNQLGGAADATNSGKIGPRRWRQCSHEFNYNLENLSAIGAEVPGADTSLPNWNNADNVWSIPVWWDSTQE